LYNLENLIKRKTEDNTIQLDGLQRREVGDNLSVCSRVFLEEKFNSAIEELKKAICAELSS